MSAIAIAAVWAKRAQQLHGKVEELTAMLEDEKLLRQAAIEYPVNDGPLWIVGEDVFSTGLGAFKPVNEAARVLGDAKSR